MILKNLREHEEKTRIDAFSSGSSKKTQFILDRCNVLNQHGLVQLDENYKVRITDSGELFLDQRYISGEHEESFEQLRYDNKIIGIGLVVLLALYVIYGLFMI